MLGHLRDITGTFVVPMLTLSGVAIVMLLLALTRKPVIISNAEELEVLTEERELAP